MSGHMGDLSEKQQELFDSFRASELEAHQSNQLRLTELDRARALKQSGAEATEDELAALRAEREQDWPYELLRFLRAHKWDVDKARETYRDYLQWREREGIDSILDEIPFNAHLLDRIVGNHALGEDPEGRPIYIERSGGIHVDGMLALFTDEDIIRGHMWQQENSCRRARELSRKHGKHVETFCQIVDLSGLSMAHQRALKLTKLLFAMDAKYYPERLGHLYVVNAPWVFPVIWKLISGLIDPVTRAKIDVVPGDAREFLRSKIDPSQLPSAYGGQCAQCPASPDCCVQSPLEDVLAILPLREDNLSSPLTPVTIKAGKVHAEELGLEAGQVAEWMWKFVAEKDDIDFTVTFTPWEDPSKVATVVATARIQSCIPAIPAQCSYLAREGGTLRIEFSNKHSWMASKQLEVYVARVDARKEALVPELPNKKPQAAAQSDAAASSSSSASAPAPAAAEAEAAPAPDAAATE